MRGRDLTSSSPRRSRPPLGYKTIASIAGLLALTAAVAVVAIILVQNLSREQTHLDNNADGYADAVQSASLAAKGIANDQRGFLLSGDEQFVTERQAKIDTVHSSLAAAGNTAQTTDQRVVVQHAAAGFDLWVSSLHNEIELFRSGAHQQAIDASLGPDRELRKSYEGSLTRARSLADVAVQHGRQSVSQAASRTIRDLLVALAVALVLGAGIGAVLMRTIALPVYRLVHLLTASEEPAANLR